MEVGEGRWGRNRAVSEHLLTAFLCFLQAFSAGEGADKKKTEWKAKLKTASGEPLMTCYGWYLEALEGKVDVSVGLVFFYLAAPATAADTP